MAKTATANPSVSDQDAIRRAQKAKQKANRSAANKTTDRLAASEQDYLQDYSDTIEISRAELSAKIDQKRKTLVAAYNDMLDNLAKLMPAAPSQLKRSLDIAEKRTITNSSPDDRKETVMHGIRAARQEFTFHYEMAFPA